MAQFMFQHSNLYGPESRYYDAEGHLQKESRVYYNCEYTHYGEAGNPDFINCLKNTFQNEREYDLQQAKALVRDIIYQGIIYVMNDQRLSNAVVVCAPRAKKLESYAPNQLYFIDAVNEAAEAAGTWYAGVKNGVSCIRRHTDTRTTHLNVNTSRVMANGEKENGNGGPDIYPGICADTCYIRDSLIRGQTVILVDDIYTKKAHVDVDIMNALYEKGAEKVFLLTVAKTVKRSDDSRFAYLKSL